MDDSEIEADGRIAVIGMAGRFPGAPDLTTFWANLRDGVESIRYFTDDELLAAGESSEAMCDPSYVRAAASLADIDKFDPAFFGMSPRDAAVFDPQHRIFLECAWEAFEQAGYVGGHIDGAVGVFASCGLSEYMFKNVLANAKLKASVGEWLIRHTGNDTNFLATRTSYELDLRGPSMNVQTACSSTLVAIHLACQSLLSGECDLALAGGAVISPIQDRGYFYKEGEILSPDGHCRAFDADSAGTIISSAAGCVLLKPLAAAIADGDTILAVVRGSAINNDGRAKVGYLAPSVSGQARVISEALAVADVDPRDVSYVEMHGTGTLIGDPIEVAGITEAFRHATDDVQFCAIGSIKPNIGHAGEASGIASFIKTVLALIHEEIPPSLHYRTPNPQADFANSPFFVNDRLRPWTVEQGMTRIAGITGLGAGGTNAHVVLEGAPSPQSSGPSRAEQLVLVSARTKEGVQQAAADLAAHLRSTPDVVLADVAFTRLAGRALFRHRRAVVAASAESAADALESSDSKTVIVGEHAGTPPSIVFMMPGGGAQYIGMGAGLYEHERVFADAIDVCNHHLRRTHDIDLLDAIVPTGSSDVGDKQLQSPSLALPALFAIGYATAKLLESWGISPTAMIGHSAGEYVVACLSGVISIEDGLDLVALRGRLFETLPTGRMLSVSLSEDELRARLPDGLDIAAVNAPGLCVVSGPDTLIAAMQRDLERDEIDCMGVPIDVAAHSAMLEPILAEFRTFCRTIKFHPPTIPYVSNVTGRWIIAAEATDPEYWVRHLRHTVRFAEGIATIMADPNRVLVEIGPGRTLSGLARAAAQPALAIAPTMRHPKEIVSDVGFALACLGKIWSAGVDLDPAALFAGQRRHRVPMPTYPFDRQSYWVDPDPVATSGEPVPTSLKKIANISNWFSTPSWHRTLTPSSTDEAGLVCTWLVVSDGSPLAEAVCVDLRSTGQRVVTVEFGTGFEVASPGGFRVGPSRPQDWAELISHLGASNALPERIIHMSALGRSRGRRVLGLGSDGLEAFRATVQRDQTSLLLLAQALSARSAPMRLACVTSGVYDVGDGAAPHVERALLHGTCRVIPRELGTTSSISIDLDEFWTTSAAASRQVARRITDELRSDPDDVLAVYSNHERWTRTFDRISLPPTTTNPWRPGCSYLITGGLGGIGLTVAEHIAEVAKGATLELVGRSVFPDESRWDDLLLAPGTSTRLVRQIRSIRRMRDNGARVVLRTADVTDAAAMTQVIADSRARSGPIVGVVHAAGVLQDALIALRSPVARSAVVDVKVAGMLVLERAMAKHPPEFFVLCSSVSSILGLPGQADYTAANAFLDAAAAQRNATTATRYLSINWSAWQEVGMAIDATAMRPSFSGGSAPSATGPLTTSLLERFDDDGTRVVGTTSFSRQQHWLLDEHAVRGGNCLIPGTGHLELLREAVAAAAPPASALSSIELTDVFFLAPFVIADDEVRDLHVEFDRTTSGVNIYSESTSAPHVTSTAAWLEPEAVPCHDLEAIRARCTTRRDAFDGYPVQPFMIFGPRWGNLREVAYGAAEALVTLAMPDPFVAELEDLWLHPALLDLATGSAQALIPRFSADASFYVPFSYARLLVRGPMPQHVISHVRLRESFQDTAVFDITITDTAGNEVIDITGFTMRLTRPGSAIVAPQMSMTARAGSVLANPIEAAIREGILPTEGVEALDRLLVHKVGPQVVASAIDLRAWTAKTDADADHDPGPATDDGPRFGRPDIGTEFEEPSTPIERELADMWRDLLGVHEVGRNDDFFELGGQSLVAVRLFTRIRARYSIDLPMTTLFEASTIGRCAAVIASKLGIADVAEALGDVVSDSSDPTQIRCGGAGAQSASEQSTQQIAAEDFRSLVTIQRGGDRVPYFCVHGAGGNVLNFRDMSRAMGYDQPFYGLQARGVDGVLRPHESIESMATSYLAEVRAERPNGPYAFGGYSGGGLVAYEMARQATEAGETVDLVVLLDTIPVTGGNIPITMSMRLDRLRRDGRKYVRDIVQRRIVERRRSIEMRRLDRVVANGQTVPSELREMNMERSFARAADAYTLRPWTGRVILIRADDPHFVFDALGESYGWDKIIRGGIEVLRVPGNHDTLMLEPNATTMVKTLWRALDSGPGPQKVSRS